MYPTDVFRETLSRLFAILARHAVRFHLTGGGPGMYNHGS